MNRHYFELAVFTITFVAACVVVPLMIVVVFFMALFGFGMLALADFIVLLSGEDEERP